MSEYFGRTNTFPPSSKTKGTKYGIFWRKESRESYPEAITWIRFEAARRKLLNTGMVKLISGSDSKVF